MAGAGGSSGARKVAAIQRREQIPLVPSDPGHVLEERIDVDAYRSNLLAEDSAPVKAAPASAKGAREVPADVDEETCGGGETAEHWGEFYSTRGGDGH